MGMDPRLEQVTLAHERSVRALSDRTGAPLTHVRALFAYEFARLELRATVRCYLPLLTAANVRAMLVAHDITAPISQRLAASLNRKRRKPLLECPPTWRSEPVAPLTLLDRWEDDGGAGPDAWFVLGP